MAEIIRLPRFTKKMEEGVIRWHKKVGDSVAFEDKLATIEANHITYNLESLYEGILLFTTESVRVKVNSMLAVIGERGEDYDSLYKSALSNPENYTPPIEKFAITYLTSSLKHVPVHIFQKISTHAGYDPMQEGFVCCCWGGSTKAWRKDNSFSTSFILVTNNRIVVKIVDTKQYFFSDMIGIELTPTNNIILKSSNNSTKLFGRFFIDKGLSSRLFPIINRAALYQAKRAGTTIEEKKRSYEDGDKPLKKENKTAKDKTRIVIGMNQFMKNTENMNSIFHTVQLKQPNWIERLLKQTPQDNAVIEINNLLATKPVSDISREDITNVLVRYKGNIIKTYARNFYEFYAAYLTHCLKDKVLSEDEIADLRRLKELFGLTDKDVKQIHDQLTSAIYKESMDKVIADGRLDEGEKAFLEKLERDLRLPSELATKISEQARTDFANNYINQAVSDQRLSPDEEAEFEAICNSLMVKSTMDANTKATLDRYRLFWLIEHGEVSPISCEINLQKNESCYFRAHVDWYEQRTVTTRYNYGGPTMSVRIMKGVYYRAGSIGVQRISSDEWKRIDSGEIFLTNKRIIFVGSKKNTSIRLDRVLSFVPYTDGIEINKDAGRSPRLLFNSDVELCALLLSRLLKEN